MLRILWHLCKCSFGKKSKIKVYHTSPTRNRASILKHGLLPASKINNYKLNYPPRTFLSNTKKDIATMDFINCWDDIDIWEVSLTPNLLKKDEFSHLPYHYYVEFAIPPKSLKLAMHIPPSKYEQKQLKTYFKRRDILVKNSHCK